MTLIVLPFLTQVIVIFLFAEGLDEGDLVGREDCEGCAKIEADGEADGDADEVGEGLSLGELVGVGDAISAALIEGVALGDALTAATGAAVGNRLMS